MVLWSWSDPSPSASPPWTLGPSRALRLRGRSSQSRHQKPTRYQKSSCFYLPHLKLSCNLNPACFFLQDEPHHSPSVRRSPVQSPEERLTPERVSKRSSNSLDLNANENVVSEQSGSESEEGQRVFKLTPLVFFFGFNVFSCCPAVEERISLSEVPGRLYLNRVFLISASKMFDLLFTDSSFTRRCMNARKITSKGSFYSHIPENNLISLLMFTFILSDLSLNAWQKDSSGNAKRTLNYTITITNPLVGKFSTATENQVCVWRVVLGFALFLAAYLSFFSLSDSVQRIQGGPVLHRGLGGLHARRSLSRLLLHTNPLLHRGRLKEEVPTQVILLIYSVIFTE